MRSMPVVVMEPSGKIQSALPGVMVSTSISPLAQGSLNESFRLAIGARREGFGEEVADAVGLAEATEDPRFIARAVIREEAVNANAKAGKEGNGSLQESGCGRALLVGVDGRKSHAGMIINGDMNILPTPTLGLLPTIAIHAMTDAGETGQFLDVEVKQASRQGIFIAEDRGRGLEQSQTVQAPATQNTTDGSGAETGGGSNATASPALPPEMDNLVNEMGGCGLMQAMGARTAIAQASWSFVAKATHPLGCGFGADVERGCSRVQPQLLHENFSDKCLSTPKRESGILVKVHSSLQEKQIGFAPSASPV